MQKPKGGGGGVPSSGSGARYPGGWDAGGERGQEETGAPERRGLWGDGCAAWYRARFCYYSAIVCFLRAHPSFLQWLLWLLESHSLG